MSISPLSPIQRIPNLQSRIAAFFFDISVKTPPGCMATQLTPSFPYSKSTNSVSLETAALDIWYAEAPGNTILAPMELLEEPGVSNLLIKSVLGANGIMSVVWGESGSKWSRKWESRGGVVESERYKYKESIFLTYLQRRQLHFPSWQSRQAMEEKTSASSRFR